MEILRSAILQPGPPENFALQIVQDVNQTSETNKISSRRESVAREYASYIASGNREEPIMQYGQFSDNGEHSLGQIPCLLDAVLHLCEKEHIEGGMIFQLLEDLTEMCTIRNCKDVFGYIESKQDVLGKQELFARGKLVMLRTCNQLLRRLSKANDVIFCGRILMFLAHFFPLSERSAVNVKGVFNISNATKYEKDPPMDIFIDFNFYKTLWSLQEYFCNPVCLIVSPSKWQNFVSSLMVVLSTFEGQPLTEEEGVANSLEEEAATFNIKYLTSSKLMSLELKDPSFRRHILVQCLILFDYMKNPGKNDKDLTSETMKEEIRCCEERVKRQLEITPPKGQEFLHKVQHILDRENNWVWWKRDGCLPFEKHPAERKMVPGGSKKRPRWRLGNKELSQLWKWAEQNPNALTDPQRVRTPTIADYWKPLADDMDPSAGIEADYHHRNNRVYCWKGLRFSARQDLEGFSRFTEHGIEGVVPLELVSHEVRSKFQAKPSDRSKRPKKDEATKANSHHVEETQIGAPASDTDREGGMRNGLEASIAPSPIGGAIVAAQSAMVENEYQALVDAHTVAEMDGENDADIELDLIC